MPATVENTEIQSRKMLFVEGEDDIKFLIALKDQLNIHGLYITGVDGKANFRLKLPDQLDRENFNKLTHFGIIRDRDDDETFKAYLKFLRGWDFQIFHKLTENLPPVLIRNSEITH